MMAVSPEAFPTGWYGKIPGMGDFVARRLASHFTESWHRWQQTVIAGSRERLGADWRESYLSMPVWRFVFSPGLLTEAAWAGIVAPSVDAVGRYFPLAIAAELPSKSLDLVRTMIAAQPWLDEMDALALQALAPRADMAALDAAIAARPFRAEWLCLPEARDETVPLRGAQPQLICLPLAERHSGAQAKAIEIARRLSEPCGAWLAEESEVFGRCLALCETLPPAEQYCAMMDGRWAHHGWSPRPLATGAAA
jgi:type VI secretion system protein ImpM